MNGESAFEVGLATVQIKRIADVLVASQSDLFVRSPAITGYFPMSVLNAANGWATNHGGSGDDLEETGDCPVGYDGNSYRHFPGGTNYLSAGGYNVSGLEAWVEAGIRGLTVGGWFYPDAVPGTQAGLITKMGVITDYSFGMVQRSTGEIQGVVSNNGSALNTVVGDEVPLGSWHFLAMRFTPSTELAVWMDGLKTTLETAIVASLYATSQDFEVGRHANNNSWTYHGRARDIFICQAALPDALIDQLRLSSAP